MNDMKWRFAVTLGGKPSWNMALDEALLLSHEEEPVFRIYTWDPAGVSLGYFQPIEDLGDAVNNRPWVRRITGGLAIYHFNELTWSLCCKQSMFPGKVENSYRAIHEVFIHAMEFLGAKGLGLRGKTTLESDSRKPTPWCFEKSSSLDIVWKKRKLMGSAQRRKDGRLMHHGSLPLGMNPITSSSAFLGQVLGKTPGLHELAEALFEAFTRKMGVRFLVSPPTRKELELAEKLVKEKHEHPSHLFRKGKRKRPSLQG